MSRDDALAYLADHHVLTLATAGPDGIWAAAVFYANEAFDLFFLSAGSTRHGSHISHNPRVAATIQEDYRSWQKIKGIQLEGRAILLQGDARQDAIAIYSTKFPFLADAPAEIQGAFERVNWYRLRPEALFFVDNSRGFGHREQIL